MKSFELVVEAHEGFTEDDLEKVYAQLQEMDGVHSVDMACVIEDSLVAQARMLVVMK